MTTNRITLRRRPGDAQNAGDQGVALCEALEGRQMLALHTAADYFPLDAASTWNYSGTLNGGAITASAAASAGPTLSGFATTRLTTVFQPDGAGAATTDSRYYAHTVSGLRLLSEDVVEPSLGTSIAHGAGARWLPPTFDDGQVIRIVKTFSEASSNGRSFTGRFVGDMTINGIEIIDTTGGSFQAVKISLVGAFNADGSTGWTGSGTIAETRWLVKGLGTVRVDFAQTISYSDRAASSLRYNMALTASSRLGDLSGAQVTGKSVVIGFGDTTPGVLDGTNFAGIDINGGTKTRIFKITNTSGAPITLIPGSQGFVTISGASAGEFTVIRQPAQTVLPGQTTVFWVRFDPAGTGFRPATVSFATTTSAAHPFAFDVRGTGIYIGAINVFGGAQVAITNGSTTARAQDNTSFGSVVSSGTTSIARTFTVYNSGVGYLAFSGTPRILIDGGESADFLVTLTPADAVAPGATTTFTVTFDPRGLGLRGAVVSIATNDRFNPVFTFALSGTGV